MGAGQEVVPTFSMPHRAALRTAYVALNVAAVLLAFIALIYLANGISGLLHTNLQTLLGSLLAPWPGLSGYPGRTPGPWAT